MFPPEGSSPLPLAAGIVPLVVAGCIGLYIALKLSRQWWLRRQIVRHAPLLEEFAHYPELQGIEAELRRLHFRAREAESADELLAQGLTGARELRDAGENLARIKAARAEIAAATAALAALEQEGR